MKNLRYTTFFTAFALLFFFVIHTGFAQKQEKKKKKNQTQAEVDNSFAPYTPESSYEPESGAKTTKKVRKKIRKKDQKNAYRYQFMKNLEQKQEEFYKRLKKNAREDRKIARKMRKPQYSDPMYFGHKRKPKKRPVGKRKFCKECGIVH